MFAAGASLHISKQPFSDALIVYDQKPHDSGRPHLLLELRVIQFALHPLIQRACEKNSM
ncbi:hypothetical protein ACFSTD_20695 [Novosphingobium colocasiae]